MALFKKEVYLSQLFLWVLDPIFTEPKVFPDVELIDELTKKEQEALKKLRYILALQFLSVYAIELVFLGKIKVHTKSSDYNGPRDVGDIFGQSLVIFADHHKDLLKEIGFSTTEMLYDDYIAIATYAEENEDPNNVYMSSYDYFFMNINKSWPNEGMPVPILTYGKFIKQEIVEKFVNALLKEYKVKTNPPA